MNIAAYCRAFTDKAAQHNSLEIQKEFLLYTKRIGDNLIKLYVDEGISGNRIKTVQIADNFKYNMVV